jgi:uncharacterized Zn-binding protein involved in type VI secretion
MMLRLAKVTKVHHPHRSVDLVYLDNGWPVSGAQVMAPSASTCTGVLDLPEPIVKEGEVERWDPELLDKRDMLAVVAEIGTFPVVIGFLLPQISEMVFDRPNFAMNRHASDLYQKVDDLANFEIYHPSRAWISMGAIEHEELSGKDYDKRFKLKRNTKKKVVIALSNGSGWDECHVKVGLGEHGGDIEIEGGNVVIKGNTKVRIEGGEVEIQGGNIYLNKASGVEGVARVGDKVRCPAGVGVIIEGSGTVHCGD